MITAIWLVGILVWTVAVFAVAADKSPTRPERYCQEKPTYCSPWTNGAGE